jgi:tetratricopeptide (TPR) repeat protein
MPERSSAIDIAVRLRKVSLRKARLAIVEAPAGALRREWLKDTLTELLQERAEGFYVSCDFDSGGPWAGVSDLFTIMLADMQEKRPDLIEEHALELVYILPELSQTIKVRNPNLTDLSWGHERTRNYPADRAYRNVHGLIDLLDKWKSQVAPGIRWVIACDGLDKSGEIGRMFFRELLRRRGNTANLQLLVAVDPEEGDSLREYLSADTAAAIVSLNLLCEPQAQADPEDAARRANELEERVGDDRARRKANLPEIIRLWRIAKRPDRVVYWNYFGLETYNTAGLYSDALRYGDGLLKLAAEHAPEDGYMRWCIVLKLMMSNIGLGNVKECLALATGEGERLVANNPYWRVQFFYMMAILHARYLKPRDMAKGEAYLERGLEAIELSDLEPEERHFNIAFNRNGLAMIRNFQGRHHEAIELCRRSLEILDLHLSTQEHRLHRSVLIYNIAQVYNAAGAHIEAIKYYSDVIEMDPNYSEYYNERGNIFLGLDRLEEAKADYLKAIELSPPYFEVFTNLGQCYRRSNELEKAIDSYSRALDLEPAQLLALLGRAKANEELGHVRAAIWDYNSALRLDPNQWDVLASRAVLRYEDGKLRESLDDFTRAIELEARSADLYENRATVLEELGRFQEAAEDLERALALTPPDGDRQALELKIERCFAGNRRAAFH